MPLRYKIDAVDAEVNNLSASFAALNKFAAATIQSRSQWAKFGPDIKAAVKTADDLTHLMSQHAQAINGMGARYSSFQSAASVAGRIFNSLARDSKALATNVARMAISFFDIATIVGVVGGVVGFAGGLFGLDESARGAMARRRTALGMGVNYGAMQSFGVNLGRFVDAPGMLGAVATGDYDVTSPQRLALLAAGINPNVGTATDQATALLERLPQLLAGTPDGMIGPVAQSRHYTDVLSQEDIVRYMNASPEERAKRLSDFRKGSADLDLSPAVLSKWADFSTALDRAAGNIEAILGNKLAGLSEPLQHLSDGMVKVTEAFIGSKSLADLLDQTNKGMETFAKYIGTAKFKNDASHFLEGLEVLGPYIKKTVEIAAALGGAGWKAFRLLDPSDPYNPPHFRDFLRDALGVGPLQSPSPAPDRSGRAPRPSIRYHNNPSSRSGTTGTHGNDETPSDNAPFWWEGAGQNPSLSNIAPLPGESTEQLKTRIQATYPTLSNQECVELARKVAGISQGVWDWRRGANALDERLPIGTPVATFMDRAGNPSEYYDAHQGVGISGNNTTHAAVIAGYDKDGKMILAEQWTGSGGVQYNTYSPGDPRGGEKDARNYFAVNDELGLPAGTKNPYREQVQRAIAYNRSAGDYEGLNKALSHPVVAPGQSSMLHTMWGLKRNRSFVVRSETINSTIVDANGMAYG